MAGGMKRLAKDTAIYGLSSIVGRFLNWMMVPLYTRVLVGGTKDFGTVTNLYGWTALLLVLLCYGMETGLFRFISKKEEERPMRVYGTALCSLGFTSALFLAACMLCLQPVSRWLAYADHPEYIGMLAAIVAMDAFCCIPFAYLRYRRKVVRFATIKLINIGLNILLNFFFLVVCPVIYLSYPGLIDWIDRFYRIDYGVGYIFISNMITSALTCLMLLPEIIPGFRAGMDFRVLRQMLAYSFPIMILGIAGILNQTIDKILFPFLLDDRDIATAELGVYGACFKIAVVMVMFVQAFRYAYEPFVFARNRGDDNRKAYAEAMKYFIIFSWIIFLGVAFYLDDVLKYFVDAKFYPGLKVVPVVMFGELCFGIYFNLSVWYKLTDRTIWGALFSVVGCILTFVIIVCFVPGYSYIACAWASVASNATMMALSYLVGRKKYPVAYDVRSALFYSLLAAGLFAAGTCLRVEPAWLRLLYRSVLWLLFVGTVVGRDLPLSELPYAGRFFKRTGK
ncbi:MAG: oligosaccharide flippase family protein [Tannerella sp.]|jgi:O-antigen/teichoic acid export membrane protein|nr:oligosaccharide flippase family protein [Tannerella sp.]